MNGRPTRPRVVRSGRLPRPPFNPRAPSHPASAAAGAARQKPGKQRGRRRRGHLALPPPPKPLLASCSGGGDMAAGQILLGDGRIRVRGCRICAELVVLAGLRWPAEVLAPLMAGPGRRPGLARLHPLRPLWCGVLAARFSWWMAWLPVWRPRCARVATSGAPPPLPAHLAARDPTGCLAAGGGRDGTRSP